MSQFNRDWIPQISFTGQEEMCIHKSIKNTSLLKTKQRTTSVIYAHNVY